MTSMPVEKPNVLLVIVDEWRAQSFGYTGDPNAHTPVIDEFAESAVNFREAISGTPVCSPARASFLTGEYPLDHGVYVNDVPLQPDKATLADAFRDSGYATGYIGKWHLYGSPDGWFGRRSAFIPPSERLGFEFWKVGECSHDYWNSIFFEGNDAQPKVWPGYDAFSQTEAAIDFMSGEASAERPFFLALSYGPPHFPLETAPEKYRDMYGDREIELRPNVPDDCREAAIADLRGYYAHMAAVDDCFGQLLAALDDRGIADDTIVVFTSDHGDMMWSQGVEFKLLPWEESIAVPLLVRAPGRDAGVSDSLFNSPDLMPTILGFAGLEAPEGIAGHDLSDGDESLTTAYLSVPVPFSSLRWYGVEEYRGVRDQRFTYVETRDGPWLLYDRRDDPYQLSNRVDDPTLEGEQGRLKRELAEWQDRLDDAFLPANEYLSRDGLEHFYEVNEPLGYSEGPGGQWASTSSRGRNWCIDTPVELLVENEPARSVLEAVLPVLLSDGSLSNGGRDSIRVAALLNVGLIDAQRLAELDEDLMRLGSRDANGADRVSFGRIGTKATRRPKEYRQHQ